MKFGVEKKVEKTRIQVRSWFFLSIKNTYNDIAILESDFSMGIYSAHTVKPALN